MGKYLHTEGRQEQRGRAEDGPTGIKPKWTAYGSRSQDVGTSAKSSGIQTTTSKTSVVTKASGSRAGITGASK